MLLAERVGTGLAQGLAPVIRIEWKSLPARAESPTILVILSAPIIAGPTSTAGMGVRSVRA